MYHLIGDYKEKLISEAMCVAHHALPNQIFLRALGNLIGIARIV
jgi:hypothetical protein